MCLLNAARAKPETPALFAFGNIYALHRTSTISLQGSPAFFYTHHECGTDAHTTLRSLDQNPHSVHAPYILVAPMHIRPYAYEIKPTFRSCTTNVAPMQIRPYAYEIKPTFRPRTIYLWH